MKKRNINYKKLVEELFYLILALLGVVILICNITKTCPNENLIVSYIIGYGFILGPALTVVSIGAFLEARE